MKIVLIIFLILFYLFFGLIVTGSITDGLWLNFQWYKKLTKKQQNILKLVILIFWPLFGLIYIIINSVFWFFIVLKELLEDTFDIYI